MDWEQRWQMAFNIKKCHILTITRKKSPLTYNYQMHGSPLERVSSATYLGVEISSTLSWEPHISNITAKANNTLSMLRRNLKHAPQNTKVLAYKALVRPRLEYSSPVWDPHQAYLKDSLERIQRRAARFIFNSYNTRPLNNEPRPSVTGMLTRLQWPPLEQRRLDARLFLFYRAVQGMVAIPVISFLAPAVAPQRRTRNSHTFKFQIPYSRTDLHKLSFFPNTVR
jgi:hypothetical protein